MLCSYHEIHIPGLLLSIPTLVINTGRILDRFHQAPQSEFIKSMLTLRSDRACRAHHAMSGALSRFFTYYCSVLLVCTPNVDARIFSLNHIDGLSSDNRLHKHHRLPPR